MTNRVSLTYRELREDTGKVVGMRNIERLHRLMLPNGLDFLSAWAGIGDILTARQARK
jgi:hypothetical protein